MTPGNRLHSPAPAPARPAGLILAAIMLALMTGQGLLTAAVLAFSSFVTRVPNAGSSGVTAILIGMAIFILLVCCACGATVVGLFRLRRWARYSIIVIGALMAVFAAMFGAFFLVFAFSSSLSRQMPAQSGVSPMGLKAAFLTTGSVCLLAFLVGVWWVIYFNRRNVRLLFAPGGAANLTQPVMDPAEPQMGAPTPAAVPGRTISEVLVTCLGVLYLLGAFGGIFTAFWHFPLYVAGLIVRGIAASVTSLAIAAMDVGIGIGLLRRVKLAWMGALAFTGFGLVSALLMLLPASRANFAAYQQEIQARMFWGALGSAAQPNVIMLGSAIYVLSDVVGAIFAGLILWLLWRTRGLFGAAERPAKQRESGDGVPPQVSW